MAMFKLLFDIQPDKAITIAYFAIRIITELVSMPDDLTWDKDNSLKDLVPKEYEELVRSIIDEIEKAEGISLVNLSKERAEGYITQISSIIQDLTRKEIGHDEQRGQALLGELRKGESAWTYSEQEEPNAKA